MSEHTTITLGVIIKSARMLAPVLHLGGRHEAARVINQLCAAVEQLVAALAHEQERAAALTQALQESVIARSAAFRAGVDASAVVCRGLMNEQSEAMRTFTRFKNKRGADDASIGVQIAAECERRVLALKAGAR